MTIGHVPALADSGLATTGRTGSKHQSRPFDVTFLILWK